MDIHKFAEHVMSLKDECDIKEIVVSHEAYRRLKYSAAQLARYDAKVDIGSDLRVVGVKISEDEND